MRTIDKLALRDKYWQSTALTICKDKDLAKDLVQDMYIKLADSEFESDWYVINTIRNLFIDMTRKLKTNSHDENISGKYVSDNDCIIHSSCNWDEAIEISNKKHRPKQPIVPLRPWMDVAAETPFEPTDKEQILLDRFYDLDYTKQELIEESYYKSDRQIGEEFNINYGYVHKKRIEGIKEILGDDFDMYNNVNLKHLLEKKEEPEESDEILTDKEFSSWVDGLFENDDTMTDDEFNSWVNKVTIKKQ